MKKIYFVSEENIKEALEKKLITQQEAKEMLLAYLGKTDFSSSENIGYLLYQDALNANFNGDHL